MPATIFSWRTESSTRDPQQLSTLESLVFPLDSVAHHEDDVEGCEYLSFLIFGLRTSRSNLFHR